MQIPLKKSPPLQYPPEFQLSPASVFSMLPTSFGMVADYPCLTLESQTEIHSVNRNSFPVAKGRLQKVDDEENLIWL
jgi:hypothetical protein